MEKGGPKEEEDETKLGSQQANHDAGAEPELEYDEEINSIVTEGKLFKFIITKIMIGSLVAVQKI